MNVLFLSPSASLGGAERVLLSMLSVLRRQCPQVNIHVLTLGQGPLSTVLANEGIATTALPLPDRLARLGDSQWRLGPAGLRQVSLLWQSLAALPGLGQFLRRFRLTVRALAPDLLHSNGIKTHLLTRLAGVDDVPTLWHVHDFYDARPLASRLLNWASSRVRGAIAISQAVAQDLRTVIRERPVTVIPNAIDVERFQPRAVDAANLDRLAGLPPAPPGTARIGLVATYARWKGHDVFLQAAADLLHSTPQPLARFYLIGGPVYRTQGSQFQEAELRAAVQRLGLTPHVGFLGFQERPEEIYPTLDVAVHASTRPEPFGLTIVEAMACGRAVVAVQAGGAAEILEPGRNALGVPPGDVAALAQGLRLLLHDPALRTRLGQEARKTALERFNQGRLGAQLEAVYRQVLAGRESALPRPACTPACLS